MKKILLVILAGALVVPFFVSADSYDGPYCFEKPGDYAGVTDTGVANGGVRGTCKEVQTQTVVSLDPALQKDYFLGTHAPVEYGCDPTGCVGATTYSEYLFLTSSSTLEAQNTGVEESPLQYALFGKAYFVPLLSKMFKASSVSFSESTLPNLGINIFKKSELDEIQKVESSFIPENAKMDSLNTSYTYLPERYTIYSLNYQEYGKYIYAPKGTLAESQYADFEKATNILSDKDLQVTLEGGRNLTAVVPITSPLKSVANYWLYTKKDGKLTLAWQKSEYGLDNGQVKVVTGADKNITSALLFSNAFPAPETATPSLESTSSTASTSATLPVEQKKGFFARVLDLILSWFR